MPMPNFLIIGAAKAGTTALHSLLNKHPEVYMSPVKEPRFFAYEGKALDPRIRMHSKTIVDIESYRALFDGVSTEKAIGESSPSYLHTSKAVERIQHYIPDAKLIAILRNPADRAYSHFLHHVRNGVETARDFQEAFSNPDGLRIGDWRPRRAHVSFGFYHEQLSRYHEFLQDGKMLVLLYDDFQKDQTGVLEEIFRFIDVSQAFIPGAGTKVNPSGIPRSVFLDRLLGTQHPVRGVARWIVPQGFRSRISQRLRAVNRRKPPLSPKLRRELVELYREDILKLQTMLDRDLSAWLEPAAPISKNDSH